MTSIVDALVRVHAELMGKATEHRIIADHIKAAHPGTAQYGAWHYHDEAARAYAIAASRVLDGERPSNAEATLAIGAVQVTMPDGTPLTAAGLDPGDEVTIDAITGQVLYIEKK